MKRILALVLAMIMVLGMFAGCNPTQNPTEPSGTDPVVASNLSSAMEYLEAMYQEAAEKTGKDFTRPASIPYGVERYDVKWTVNVSEDIVKIVDNGDGTVTVDINEGLAEETPYELTATMSDEAGNTLSKTWKHLIPGTAATGDMVGIVNEAYALENGATMGYEVTLTGVITAVNTPYDTGYKNVTVTIAVPGAEDKPIMCYRLKGDGAELIDNGWTITVTGTIKNYSGTIEFDQGCVLVSYKEGEGVKAPEDPKQIVDEAYALADGATLPYTATLTGVITTIDTAYSEQYGNITVTMVVDGKENKPITCYRLKGDAASELCVGDTITVKGLIKNYKGTIEFDTGCMLQSVVPGERLTAPEDPYEILDAAYDLAWGENLPYEVILSGIVTTIDEPYSDEYDNVTVTITLVGAKHQPITCFRLQGDGVANIKKSDTITVKGYITNYEGKREFTSGCQLIEIVEQGPGYWAPDTQEEIIDHAMSLPITCSLLYDATLTGEITKITQSYSAKYGNISVKIAVKDTAGKSYDFEIYRMKGDGIEDLKKGDTITVKGNITHYVIDWEEPIYAKIQMVNGKLKKVVPGESTPTVDYPVAAPTLSEDTAYKLVMVQTNLGKALIFNGKLASGYLGTTENEAEAVDVKVEKSGDGYYFYFMDGSAKKYIGIYLNDKGKPRPQITDTAVTLFTYNKDANAYTTSLNDGKYDNDYYLGTYSEYTTIGASDAYYISGDNIGAYGTTQFLAHLMTEVPSVKPVEPEEPFVKPTTPEEIVKAAYALDKGETLQGGNYTLEGKITEIGSFNESYGDITLYIQVGEMADMPIQCYALKGDVATLKALKEGDTIKVEGPIKNFNGTVEVEKGKLLSVNGTNVSGGTDTPVVPGTPTTGLTKIDKTADLTAGTYFMSGYLTSYTNSGETTDYSAAPYHVWDGTLNYNDCVTNQYSFADGTLTGTGAAEMKLVAVSGKANTYYVVVGSKYLSSSEYGNRKLVLGDTKAEWVASDNANGGITLTTTLTGGTISLGTAGAKSKLIRSYKSESTLKYGLVFFTTGSGSTTPDPEDPTTKPTEAPSGETYSLKSTLANGDKVVIVNKAHGMALSSEAAGTYYRAGVAVTPANGKLVTDNANIIWTVETTSDGFFLKNASGQKLSIPEGRTSIGFDQSDNPVWTITDAGNGCVYIASATVKGNSGDANTLEWYASKSNFSTYYVGDNNKDLFAMELYVLSTGSTTPDPEPETSEPETSEPETSEPETSEPETSEPETTISTIKEALDAASGDFTVKGVVTFIDGKNVYIQDATGGINLYLSAAASGIAVGDTVIGAGTYGTYNGLPQLKNATFEKSEGLTLSAKTTTLAALTNADICTYVKIENLIVESISGTTVTVKEGDKTIQIYKAVIDSTIEAGDTITFTGAVGIYNNLQLRNTAATDIVLVKKGETTTPDPEPTISTIKEALDAASGDFTVKGVVTFIDGKNVYIQDATGGINLYLSAAASGIAVGDTVTGAGTYGTYNGLPQLKNATFEKSEGLTLSAKTTTLAALTNADICTYVKIENLTVTAVDGTNVTVSDGTNTIQIYKAVKPETLSVNDKVTFTGAVGTFNGLQLRNTTADEITIVQEAPTYQTLYLNPGPNWPTENARYAVYFFGSKYSPETVWVDMTDSDNDGVYEVQASSYYPNLIFVRMNPATTENNWDNKWSQSADLTAPKDDKVQYTMTDWTNGDWGTFTASNPGGETTYTMIDKVANLSAGTYYMAGYLTSYNSKDFSTAPYHVWTAASGTDLVTTQYSFEDGVLTGTGAGEVKLVAVSGKENTYYVMVGDQYLYSSSYANRKLALGDTQAEWVATDNTNGGITFTTTMTDGDINLGTAGAESKLIRSYKTLSTLKYGLVFFLEN